MLKRTTALVILAGLMTSAIQAQELNLTAKEDFLDIVAPIITKDERELYKGLPDYTARRYFENIFWYKRNADPSTTSNPFRRTYFERRQVAKTQFEEGKRPGTQSDRGQIYMMLGEPDDVVQKKLSNSGIRPGYEEIWEYKAYNLKLRFIYDGLRPYYVLQQKDSYDDRFEQIRKKQVLDRAEPYTRSTSPLALPNLGFTKDVENLVAEDRSDLEYELSYYFLRGDLNRTELMVGITFYDASDRGMDIMLAAYDPYENKVEDFKKRIQPTNGKFHHFSIVTEPDQYDMVLRLEDRDGREAIDRRRIDVPRISNRNLSASSLFAARSLKEIPLQGFRESKKFVFEDRFFALENRFRDFDGDLVFLMQHFYNTEQLPELEFYVNHKPVNARKVKEVKDGFGIRAVFSIPSTGLDKGAHSIKSVYRAESGDRIVTPMTWLSTGGERSNDLVYDAKESDLVRLVLPSGEGAESLERVVVQPADGVKATHMYVFLNGALILEQDKDPWDVRVDPGLFSISGENELVVVMDTDRGLVKVSKSLKPLRADENIQTRAVQIFFNAFTEDLKFVGDLDLSTLTVEVDREEVKPREIRKVEEPITYCFLVDNSYSMKDSFESNMGAVRRFIQSIRPEDQGYFVTFSDNYEQHMEPNRSKDVLLAVSESLNLTKPNPKFADNLYLENTTFLYDAVISSVHALHQYPGRKVIVIVTDGIGTEGIYRRAAMLSYARQNDVVIYSLWLDNNPTLSDDETKFLQKEQTRAEKVVRAIGLSRFFAKKDKRKNYIGQKIRKSAINQGAVKILAEESGGFHYRIFRADRSLIRDYVQDIEQAIQNQYVLTLDLPVSMKELEVEIYTSDEKVSIRNKSHVKVRKSNPLAE